MFNSGKTRHCFGHGFGYANPSHVVIVFRSGEIYNYPGMTIASLLEAWLHSDRGTEFNLYWRRPPPNTGNYEQLLAVPEGWGVHLEDNRP